MHILFIANTRMPTERAMGTAVMHQCSAFVKAGHTVELVVPRRKNIHTEDPFVYHGVEKNFTIRMCPSLDAPVLRGGGLRFVVQKVTFILSLMFFVWRSNADILYTREPELVGFVPTKKKKFIELHHLYGLRLFGTFFLRGAAGIITITEALKADVSTQFGIEYGHIAVAPSGVDLQAFAHVTSKEEIRARFGIHGTLPIALYCGALEAWKGYTVFLDAAVMLEGQVHCVVIGGTDARRDAYPVVQFLGSLPQRDLPHNQQIADVLVVPNSGTSAISARHTSPLKVFAHMASNIPIVASAVPSICEILSDQNAYLVLPDDPAALATGIREALQDRDTRHARSERAYRDVQQYDWGTRTRRLCAFIASRV
jgi:glycosyltransferase involved in cell wall biosynthesis